ncbi:MAG: YceI family protein [Proteobacteria bacterium]|nr:YceI family protein [Pseudomonadota bacterium]
MKKFSCIIIALIFLALTGQTVFAAARAWELDNNHSNFYFRVGHIFSKINGQFNDFSGEVLFDPNNLAESRFFFQIKTESINTNIAKRDRHLQSVDFFDADKYPLITFESIKITDAGNNVFHVFGKFTIKGESYDLMLPLTLAGIKDHPAVKGKEVIGFNGELTIDRLAYKVGSGKFYEIGIVGKDVEILVTLEALSDK